MAVPLLLITSWTLSCKSAGVSVKSRKSKTLSLDVAVALRRPQNMQRGREFTNLSLADVGATNCPTFVYETQAMKEGRSVVYYDRVAHINFDRMKLRVAI